MNIEVDRFQMLASDLFHTFDLHTSGATGDLLPAGDDVNIDDRGNINLKVDFVENGL
jgi:hypothetical protein